MIKLSNSELNRTLLGRQLLLRPSKGSIESVVFQCAGLQSQKPSSVFPGLWNRMESFTPQDLDVLLSSGAVVRMAAMRSTVHLMLAEDAYTFRFATQKVLADEIANVNRTLAESPVVPRIISHARRHLRGGIRASDLTEELRRKWPDESSRALHALVRAHLPLVQVPPRGLYGQSASTSYRLLSDWSPDTRSARPRLPGATEYLVRRYLAAFGPASVADIQQWSGLTRIREVVARARPRFRRYLGPDGGELFDIPEGMIEPAEIAARPIFLGEFDNLILSHKDRSRVIPPEFRDNLRTPNGLIPPVLLVDGFVRGTWSFSPAQPGRVCVVPFGSFSDAEWSDILAAKSAFEDGWGPYRQ